MARERKECLEAGQRTDNKRLETVVCCIPSEHRLRGGEVKV